MWVGFRLDRNWKFRSVPCNSCRYIPRTHLQRIAASPLPLYSRAILSQPAGRTDADRAIVGCDLKHISAWILSTLTVFVSIIHVACGGAYTQNAVRRDVLKPLTRRPHKEWSRSRPYLGTIGNHRREQMVRA